MVAQSVSLDCPSCGAHVGTAVPGYMKAALCYCGELVAVTIPDNQEFTLIEDEDLILA